MRSCEQRHKKILGNLTTAEEKAAKLCDQQSKTRKKLSTLYSSLQDAISSQRSHLIASTSRGETVDARIRPLDFSITISSWWRISILASFTTGNYLGLTRHVGFLKECEYRSSEEASYTTDLFTPICPHLLLGICLDERCLLQHPVSLRSSTNHNLSSKQSANPHMAWLQSKNIIDLLEEHDRQRQLQLNKDDCNAKDNLIDRNLASSHDYLSDDGPRVEEQFESSKRGRYFNSVGTEKPISPSAYPESWSQLLYQCHAAVAQYGLGQSDFQDNRYDLQPSLPCSSSGHFSMKKINVFIFNLVGGFRYKDSRQRKLCICSCLSILAAVLDCPYPAVPSTFSSKRMSTVSIEDIWILYLTLSLESGVLNFNWNLMYWGTMIDYLTYRFPHSLPIIALATSVRRRLKMATSVDANHGGSTDSFLLTSSRDYGATAPGLDLISLSAETVNPHIPTLFDSVHAADWLDDLCNSEGKEAVINILCKHLVLPLFFDDTGNSGINDSIPESVSPVDALPMDFAFSMLFTLLFTGDFIGKKILYMGNSLFFMSGETNRWTRERIKSLFRRCPHLQTIISDAFLLYFKAVASDTADCVDPVIAQNEVNWSATATEPDAAASDQKCLSAIDQSILWCLNVFMSTVSFEDTVDGDNPSYRFHSVLRQCDPLCYPGVFEGVEYVTEATGEAEPSVQAVCTISVGVPSVPSILSIRRLQSAVNMFLQSTSQSLDYLSTAIATASNCSNYRCNSVPFPCSLVPQIDPLPLTLIQAFWKNNAELFSSDIALLKLAEWIVSFTQSTIDVSNTCIDSFAAFFRALFDSNQRKQMSKSGDGEARRPADFKAYHLFVAIAFYQVSTIVKRACATSNSQDTSVRLISMVLAVIEASLSLEAVILSREQAFRREKGGEYLVEEVDMGGQGDNSDCDRMDADSTFENGNRKELRRSVRKGGLTTRRKNRKGREVEHRVPSDIDWTYGMRSCIAEFDCTSPSLQHKLFIKTLNYLNEERMVNYNVIEYVLTHSFCCLGSPDIIFGWVLQWYSVREETTALKMKCPVPLLQNIPLKSASFIANLFKNVPGLCCPHFMSRLSASSLFTLCASLLSTENFDMLFEVKAVLDSRRSHEGDLFYSALLQTYIKPTAAVSTLESRETTGRGEEDNSSVPGMSPIPHIYLRESWSAVDSANDEVLRKFQEKLNFCMATQASSIDLSSLFYERIHHFPFLSLSLLSETVADLNLSSNHLGCFPSPVLLFRKLMKLNISNNHLITLPDNLHSNLADLKNLDLSRNDIAMFPTTILELTSLEQLRFSNNCLEYVPIQIQNLKKLEYLDISENKLKAHNCNLTHLRFLKT